jgi:hypothetical protein
MPHEVISQESLADDHRHLESTARRVTKATMAASVDDVS